MAWLRAHRVSDKTWLYQSEGRREPWNLPCRPRWNWNAHFTTETRRARRFHRGILRASPCTLCLLYYEPENPLLFGKDFCAFSWERTHPACGELETLSTLEACAPRDDLCVLRVSAVKSVLVAARLCENTLSGTGEYGRARLQSCRHGACWEGAWILLELGFVFLRFARLRWKIRRHGRPQRVSTWGVQLEVGVKFFRRYPEVILFVKFVEFVARNQ